MGGNQKDGMHREGCQVTPAYDDCRISFVEYFLFLAILRLMRMLLFVLGLSLGLIGDHFTGSTFVLLGRRALDG